RRRSLRGSDPEAARRRAPRRRRSGRRRGARARVGQRAGALAPPRRRSPRMTFALAVPLLALVAPAVQESTSGRGGGGVQLFRTAVAAAALTLLSLAPGLAVMAFFRARAEKVRASLLARPIASTLLGALNLVLFLVVTAALGKSPALQLPCLLIVLAG